MDVASVGKISATDNSAGRIGQRCRVEFEDRVNPYQLEGVMNFRLGAIA